MYGWQLVEVELTLQTIEVKTSVMFGITWWLHHMLFKLMKRKFVWNFWTNFIVIDHKIKYKPNIGFCSDYSTTPSTTITKCTL
jgi:hypothetical protein